MLIHDILNASAYRGKERKGNPCRARGEPTKNQEIGSLPAMGKKSVGVGIAGAIPNLGKHL